MDLGRTAIMGPGSRCGCLGALTPVYLPNSMPLTPSLAPAKQNSEPAIPQLALSAPLSCCSLGLESPFPNFLSLLRPAHPWTLS